VGMTAFMTESEKTLLSPAPGALIAENAPADGG